jgi:hypothetical protein
MTTNTESKNHAGPKMHAESDGEYADRVDAAELAHNARPTIYLRGEGGAVFAQDLPLHSGIAERLAAGKLVRVNEDGTTFSGVTDDVTITDGARVTDAKREIPGIVEDDDPDPEVADRQRAERERAAAAAKAQIMTRPNDSAAKPDWEAYARSKGATDAQVSSSTKPELIARYG